MTALPKTAAIAAAIVLATAAAAPGAAYADVAFNVGAVSDYRYRGISQSRLKPALQGGVDWSHASGVYVGAWASTIRWIDDAYGDAGVEVDLYAGYKRELMSNLTLDFGVLQYLYPKARTAQWNAAYKNPNTTEVYGGLTFGPATAKVSYATTNLFGNYDFANGRDTKGSLYVDLSATFDVGAGIVVTPHVGRQRVKDLPIATYTDYALTVSKDFNGVVPSIALVGTDADRSFYVPGGAANSTKFLGKRGVVVGVKVNF